MRSIWMLSIMVCWALIGCAGLNTTTLGSPLTVPEAGSGIVAADQLVASGRPKEAADLIIATLPPRPEPEEVDHWIRAMSAAFDAYDAAEDFSSARDTASRATQHLSGIGRERESLSFVVYLAQAQIMLDDISAAERTIEAGLARARALEPRDPSLEARLQLQSASAAHWSGDFQQAWARIEPILPVLAALPPSEAVTRYRGFMIAGRSSNRIGNREAAELWLAAAVAQAEQAPDVLAQNALPVALEALSRVYVEPEETTARVGLLERAIKQYDQLSTAGDRSHAIMVSSLAFNLRSLQRLDDARAYAERAVGMNLTLIRAKSLQAGGLTFNDTAPALHAFDALLSASLEGWPNGNSVLRRNGLEDLLAGVQQAASMMTVQDFNATAIAYAAHSPAMRRAMQAAREAQIKYEEIDARIDLVPASAGNPTNLADLLLERDRAQTQLTERRAELEAEFPDYARLASLDTESLVDIQAALKPNEALIVLHPIQDYIILAIAITGDDAAWSYETFDYEEVCRYTWALRGRLDPEGKVSCRFPPSDLYTVPVDRESEEAAARKLYDRVFAQLLPVIGGKSEWLIAPSGLLVDVPFALLRTSEHDYKGVTPWLLRERALTILPNVSALVAARRNGELESGETRSRRLVAAGAPCIGLRSGAGCLLPPSSTESDFEPMPIDAEIGVPRDGMNLGNPSGIRLLPALPFAEAELRAVAALGEGLGELLTGQDASEAKVRQRLLEPAAIVVFATHGLTAGEFGLSEPALVFTPPDAVVDPEDDGLLTASEIARLDLPTDWVILSACRTAAADGTARGRTLSGLARAFFIAGSPTLLASHWQVYDGAQASIVTRAVEARLADPSISHASALRQATLAYIEEDETGQRDADSRVWGGLFVVGLSKTGPHDPRVDD